MLELDIVSYRVVYVYTHDIYIEISKIDLDWGWVVRKGGEVLMMDTATSESSAENEALNYAGECKCV